MPMQLVGTRSRAIRRRTSKNGANLKTGQADGQEPQLRERKSGFAEAAKRSVETCSAGRAGAHLPAPAERARSYHFCGARHWPNWWASDRILRAFSAWPKTLKTQDSQPLSKYLPRKVLPISPGRLVPGAYSEGSPRVAQAQPDFPTIRRSKNAPARLTRIIHTTCIPVRHA